VEAGCSSKTSYIASTGYRVSCCLLQCQYFRISHHFSGWNVTCKDKGKVKFTLEQTTKSQKGARWGGWSTPRSGRFTPGRNLVHVVQEAGRAPEPVWTGAENLASTGIRSPDRVAHSESLYRLSYPDPQTGSFAANWSSLQAVGISE
jgi:hypothetical protein